MGPDQITAFAEAGWIGYECDVCASDQGVLQLPRVGVRKNQINIANILFNQFNSVFMTMTCIGH